MYDKFSVEEINLMCIYDTRGRSALLAELTDSIDEIYDPDMREIFESAIAKLEALTDEEFGDIGFYIADDFPDVEEA